MRKLLVTLGRIISQIIDIFYPPFRKYMDLQFFRYAVTGASNLMFDWVLYFFIFNFVLQKQMLHLGFVTLSSHIATLGFKFPVVLLTGFLLQKYVTFTAAQNRGRSQLVRYLIVVMINLTINYVGLKLLVDGLHFYPTPSNMLVSGSTVVVSYIMQKRFTFKHAN